MPQRMRIACGLAALALVAACAPRSLVVLAPDPDGKVGRITVANEAAAIDVSSHGEENLLVPTGDRVSNAQNRRVEVVVR